jgi:hypothetical protein
MDLIIELKITNVSDWAIIQPLLKRLKIPFVQKTLPKETLLTAQKQVTTTTDAHLMQGESQAVVWSPYDAYDAADVLLQALKNN